MKDQGNKKDVGVPRVSIGMPVYNGEATLRRALDSLLAQTFVDFELVISDNASTDGTPEICRDYAIRDPRVRYVRQPKNLGSVPNFAFVLSQARAPFFMWAAADDQWDPRFINANLEMLHGRPDVIASVSRVTFLGSDAHAPEIAGTSPLLGTPAENLESYLRDPAGNSRFYSLFRTEVLRKCCHGEPFWAADWAVVACTLAYGKYAEVPESLFFREPRGEGSQPWRLIRQLHRSGIGSVLPLWDFSARIVRNPDLPVGRRIMALLVQHNLYYLRLNVTGFLRHLLVRGPASL
jgi:glycosyltransferase involved in cell wall biosynthesis